MNEAPSDQPGPNPERSSPPAARAWSHTSDHVTPAEPGPATAATGTDTENSPVRSSTEPDNPPPRPIAPDITDRPLRTWLTSAACRNGDDRNQHAVRH